MVKDARAARLAVLIDADNSPHQIADNLFKEIARLGEASVRRIYGDFSGTKLKAWAEHLADHVYGFGEQKTPSAFREAKRGRRSRQNTVLTGS